MLPESGYKRYAPSDDTGLLIGALSEFSGDRCLEMGFGSGAVLGSLSGRFGLLVGTDLMSVADAKTSKLGRDASLIIADRATCFRDGVFDLVAFNPPYLPSDTIEDRAVDGGPSGVEVPMAFLEEAVRVVRPRGTIVVLLSQDGDVEAFRARAERMGLTIVERARKRLFYETLVVLSLSREGPRD